MGTTLATLSTCSDPITTCIKYVCNGATCHSTCCELCELDMSNPATPIADDSAEISIEVADWSFHGKT